MKYIPSNLRRGYSQLQEKQILRASRWGLSLIGRAFWETDLDRRRGLGGDLRALIFWEETHKVLTRGKVPWISASLRLLDARGHAK